MNTQKIKASSILVVVVLLLSSFVPAVQAESNCLHAKQEPFYLANSESVVPLNASEHEVTRYCWIRCTDCGGYLDYRNETEVVPHELTSFEWEGEIYVTCEACDYKAKKQVEHEVVTNSVQYSDADEECTPVPAEEPTITPAPTGAPTTKNAPVLLDEVYAIGDFQFRLYDNGDAVIVRYTGEETDVVFPAEMKMPGITYPVKSIGYIDNPENMMYDPLEYMVFTEENYKGVLEITISEGVESIGCCALMCPSLQDVFLPKSLLSIGPGAFASCGSLQRLNIPEGVKNIGYSAFYGCDSLSEVAIPESKYRFTPGILY